MFRLSRLIPILRFMRLQQALPAVSNSWLMVALAFDVEPLFRRNENLTEYGMWAGFGLGAVVAAGLSIYALALNDILDLRHDRAFEPDRLLPSGRVKLTSALVLALVSLASAMIAAVLLGTESALLAVVAAMGILFYNIVGKYLPAVGIVALGLILALNMFIVNPRAGFVWPIWLNMSHMMIAATLVYLLQGKRPRLRVLDFAGILAGWLFWTLALFAFMHLRETTNSYDLPWVWLGPGAAAAIYLTLAIMSLKPITSQPPKRAKATRTYAGISLLSLMLFDAGWLMALGHPGQAAMILALLALAAGSNQLLHFLEQLIVPEPGYHVSSER